MGHPFQSIPAGQSKKVFLPVLTLYLVLQTVFVILDLPLRTPAAPNGIVSFELAGNHTAALSILDSWNEVTRREASFGLAIDYLFMCVYSTMLAFACVWSARAISSKRWPFVQYGAILAWGVWLAVLFDGTENVALLVQLFGSVSDSYARLAALCATTKFALIAASLLYSAYGLAAWLVGRRWVGANL